MGPLRLRYLNTPVGVDWYDYLREQVPSIGVLYPLDEPSGTDMLDASGNGHDGTYTNAPTLAESGPVTGHTGATFNGSTQYGSAADHADMSPGTSDFSVGFWIKCSSWGPTSTFDYLFCHRGDGAAGDWEVRRYDDTGTTFHCRINSTINCSGAGGVSLADSAWHLCGYSADRSGNLQWYVDGATWGSPTNISAAVAVDISAAYTLYVARRQSGNYADATLAGCWMAPELVSATTWANLWGAA